MYSTKKSIISLAVCFVISLSTFGQKISIKDNLTNEAIANVAVYTSSKTKNQISNKNGVVDLSEFTAEDILIFSHISYENFKIKKNKIDNVIYLTNKSDELSEITLSVSKTSVKRNRVAEKIAVITKKDIELLAPQTSADLLAATPGIRVQKSQGGGGSPVIRGFEANRVLLVMDNVRMNNAIYRSGHLQNAITVNPFALERTEVVFGPSSVIYGSDALGGVVHFYSKTPKFNNEKIINGNSSSRFSSANNEITQNFGAEISLKKWASFTSFSISDFGDLRMGKNRQHGYDNWGLVTTYSDNDENSYNNNPIINQKPHVQKNTGYQQLDLLQKLNVKTSESSNLIFNFQFSESSNIPRFDKLTELKGETLKFAEWFYGPQKRLLFSPQYQFEPNFKWLNSGQITLAYQNVKESRVKRKYNSFERTYQKENVDVFSINTDFKVRLTKNRDLYYGLEFTHNDVNSIAYGKILNVQSNNIIGFSGSTVVQSRYPDGGSTYTTSAAYANYRQDINTKMTLNTGGRFTYTKLKANFIDQTYISLPVSKIELDNSSFTANLGLTYKPSDLTRFNAVISSGFRSPNIDDIGKVREKNGLLTVPNINLKPEFAYNGEIGFTQQLKNKQNIIELNGFYTLLNNYISRTNYIVENDTTTFNENTVIYDGEETPTIANTNGKTAYIIGGSLDLRFNPLKNFYTLSNITFTKGETNDTNVNLPSILPFFGSVDLEYRNKKFISGFNWTYSSKKDASDFSPGGEDNLTQTPLIDPDDSVEGDEFYIGLPSWQTFNASASYQFNNSFRLQLAIDNILDTHYKEFASGISAPGRNFRASVDIIF
ncbi:TonB-dependent receptor plug domain-containing protein [Pseudofulvibacter geojedonensis]|uniref:TonB-dependent receptor plug domain-containing protein n=1 Tax=Pseudofulvibacter geojedonensis TaxID=1123758 RepID=A0ABW3I3W5_9FLAO